MTLIYSDQQSPDRLEPTVDAHDVHANPLAHSTASISQRAEGTQTAGKVTTKDSRIIANDGNNNIGLFGWDDAGSMVVKVAKVGYDANNATNDQLIFNSGQDTFKITESNTVSIGSVSVPAGGESTPSATYNFIQTYVNVPIVLGFSVNNTSGVLGSIWGAGASGNSNSGAIVPFAFGFGTGGINLTQMGLPIIRITTTQVVFSIRLINGTSIAWTSPSFGIRLYVLQETAQ